MIQKDIITNLVISKLTDTRYFLVDVTVSADNVIKVEIDAEEGVDIDFCVELNRFIEANFDREVEDYELEVGDEMFAIEETKMIRKEGDKRKKPYTERVEFKYTEIKYTKYKF